MPGTAALLNSGVPDSRSIQLFYDTDNSNLGLVLQSGDTAKDPQKNFSANSDDREGCIHNPSDLGAAQYLGINFVVGFTRRKETVVDGSEIDIDISLLSPVYRPLAKTNHINTTTAVCSSDKLAWVYYLQGSEESNMTLYEYRLDTFSDTAHKGTTKIHRGNQVSALAAYWCPDKKRRFVIYQGAGNNDLYEYSVEDESPRHIENSTDAKEGTKMAVTYVDGKAYLYYTDDSYNLRKIVKIDNKWGSSSGVDGADEVNPASQLTVTTTVTPSNAINHIFYVKERETEKFSHVRDPVLVDF